jgi:hypothetical protein
LRCGWAVAAVANEASAAAATNMSLVMGVIPFQAALCTGLTT